MRTPRIIALTLAILLFASSVQAQNDDWRKVEFLDLGRPLHVKADHVISCLYEGATDDRLICEIKKRRSFQRITINIPREQIREIRMFANPDQGKDALIGAGIGAGAGAIAGGTSGKPDPGIHAVLGGLAGAFVGFLVGEGVPIFQLALHRSKVIYKR